MRVILKKALFIVLVLMVVLGANSAVCQANSAAPPTVLVIVPGAPSDLELRIEPQDIKGTRTDTLIESYFAFYAFDLKPGQDSLKVTTGGSSFEVTLYLDVPSQSLYTNTFRLDLKTRSLTPQKTSILRSVSLLSLQIILTLIIEGIVFFLFGFRKKRSWLVFLLLNLVTQGILFTWLTQFHAFPPNGGYIVFYLIFGEILVFIVEMAGFLVLIKERRRLLTAGYVIVANLASLALGGYIITALPVYF